ncbi:MAG: MFS transporter [Deltaproteobacteria bacterium]|nr:MFS transporter [Deltaproteobacteria bacterium]
MRFGHKLGLLGALYFSQGLPYGFFTQALPALLRKEGASLPAIGASSLLALPWALKFLWAPLVDRWYWPRWGRRRSWILPLQWAAVLTLCLLGIFVRADQLLAMMIGVLVLNLLAASQDIATDGLALDLLEPEERGLANGLQVAGYRAGMIIGGGLLLVLYERLGTAGTFFGMAALLALATLPISFTREPEIPPEPTAKPQAPEVHFFRRPQVLPVLALVVIYKTGEAFASGMLRPFLTDLGLSLEDLGWMLGTVGFVSGLLGALTGGHLSQRLGRRRALIGLGVVQAVAVAGYGGLAVAPGGPGPVALYVACAFEHFASGMATAALFTCMMDWSRKEVSATDYTVQASAVVIATGLAATFSGASAGALGYPLHFALATFLALLAVGAAAWLFPIRGPFAEVAA